MKILALKCCDFFLKYDNNALTLYCQMRGEKKIVMTTTPFFNSTSEIISIFYNESLMRKVTFQFSHLMN